MKSSQTITVGKRNRVTLPQSAIELLGINPGDNLLVDVQDGLLVLMPEPNDYASAMAGLHAEIWRGIDLAAYLRQERTAWQSTTEVDSDAGKLDTDLDAYD